MKNRSLALRVGVNIGAFVLAWALFAVGIRAGNHLGPVVQGALGLLGAGIGLFIALRLHARVASMIVAGFTLMIGVELLFHVIYGFHMVQSGPTHLAILTASLGGILLGALALSRLAPAQEQVS